MRRVTNTICTIALGVASLVAIGASEVGAGGWDRDYDDDCGYYEPRVYGSYVPLRSYYGYAAPRVYGSYRPLRPYYGYVGPRVYGSYRPLRPYYGYVGPRVYGSYRPLRPYYSGVYFRPGVYRARAWGPGYFGRRAGWRRW